MKFGTQVLWVTRIIFSPYTLLDNFGVMSEQRQVFISEESYIHLLYVLKFKGCILISEGVLNSIDCQ